MTDDLRTRLAGALTAFADLDPELADECAAAVLPVVEAHGRASAATALRDAADHAAFLGYVGRVLRERAQHLEAQP